MYGWTRALTRQALWLLLTLTTLSAPFLHVDSDLATPFLYHHPHHPHTRLPLPLSTRHATRLSDRYSRQASLMMVASNPRIRLRSSLIGSGDTCHVDPVSMAIRPPRKYAPLCKPTREISFGCRGGCSSYSRIDVWNTSKVLRSCSCCRPTGFGFRLVRMRCKGFSLRTTVKFALGCHCRPCLTSVQSVDIQRLRDLLQATSITHFG